MKQKICFVNAVRPEFLGGISNYQNNLIKYLQSKDKNQDISWIYKSNRHENYKKDGINYIGIKVKKFPLIDDFIFNVKVRKFLKNNFFNIINSHAIWGYWMKKYKKNGIQTLIHTYHGVTYPYYKVHLQRFNFITRILMSPVLLYSYLIEKPPIKKADRIICVSEKVKDQVQNLYENVDKAFVIRTGVDLANFKARNKNLCRKELGLEKDKIYGLHVAKGGFWIKGLDRAVKLSEKIYEKNKNYRLIVIGPDYDKNKRFLNKEFIISLEGMSREKLSLYNSASDIFFCLSRYEGGAPTLVVSEAMASGCIVVCSEDSQQEIIHDKINGMIINQYGDKEAEEILKTINNTKTRDKIVENSLKSIKNLSLESWGKKYLELLK